MITPLASPPATPVPLLERIRRATLGRFDVMTALGEGGMATVFLARDLALDRQVAIKVMNPALRSSPAALGRFRREARVAAALDHPHIISIFAVGEDPELAFYVMRYIEGRSLHDLLKAEGAQTFRRVESLVTDIGQALHYAHRRGVIHRDVKPANVMLDQDDWLVVTDFGIAKLDQGDRLTLSGHVFGTPHYMSPEYFNGGIIGSASDQYALGVVAFELLTGSAPFPGETIGEVMRGHLFDPIPPLRAFRPDLPPAVEDCVARMLSKEPALRFLTVADAVASLRAAGRSGESGVATELIDTAARLPIVRSPPRARAIARSMSWSTRLAFSIGAVATLGTIIVLGMSRGQEAVALPVAAVPTLVPKPIAQGAAVATESPESAPTAPTRAASTRAASTPVAPTPKPPVGSGTVRIGSRLPLAVLYVGNQPPRNIGELGIQTLRVPAGALRLQLRVDRCAQWDTTFTVRPGETHTVGYRAPDC